MIRLPNGLTALIMLSFILVAAMLCTSIASAQEAKPLRVGVLQFGTVSWELDVVEHHGLAEREGIELDIVPLSSTNALNVALQSGDVDMVVGDWIWVSRQRAAGREFTSFPYSLQVGSLLVQSRARIDSVEQLRGKRVGVAGGPVDKSWLLMRAYAREALNEDLADIVNPTYAAPPLLNELALQGELPAVINYWHYAARLEAAGMTPLLDVTEIMPKLGVKESVPLLVWMFDEAWAQEHRALVNGFLRATYRAKQILAESEAEWERIAPLTQAEDAATLRVLRKRYREGIPEGFGPAEIAAARKTFAILAREGGAELVGTSTSLSPGTFWRGFEIGSVTR
jgi:NitT/TauT family transport system substrate-binding protein